MNKSKLTKSVVFTDPKHVVLEDDSRIATVFRSKMGVAYQINIAFLPAINDLINSVRSDIEAAQASGKFVAYLSVPISARGGGHVQTNLKIAEQVTEDVVARFGDRLHVVNPGAYDLPKVDGKRAGGGEFMSVWSEVLGGVDGTGMDFDMVYFLGPNDVWKFFGVSQSGILDSLDNWIDQKIKDDDPNGEFQAFIEDGDNRKAFLKFYGLRGSAAYSKGAHDEWNIVIKLNKKREIGNDIAVYYDGTPIEPGDFDDDTDFGYEV